MNHTLGEVTASLTTCTVLDRHGSPCGRPGRAGLPVGVCEACAITITRAVMKLGGITVEARS